MTSREFRYHKYRKYNRMLYNMLAKQIQEAIDEEILKLLVQTAIEINQEKSKTDSGDYYPV